MSCFWGNEQGCYSLLSFIQMAEVDGNISYHLRFIFFAKAFFLVQNGDLSPFRCQYAIWDNNRQILTLDIKQLGMVLKVIMSSMTLKHHSTYIWSGITIKISLYWRKKTVKWVPNTKLGPQVWLNFYTLVSDVEYGLFCRSFLIRDMQFYDVGSSMPHKGKLVSFTAHWALAPIYDSDLIALSYQEKTILFVFLLTTKTNSSIFNHPQFKKND